MPEKNITLLGIKLHLFNYDEIISLAKASLTKNEKLLIFYCDFRLANYNLKQPLDLKDKNIYCYPDSSGVYFVLKLFKSQVLSGFKKLVSTDINEKLLELANKNKLTCFFLGSENKILELFIKRVSNNYQNLLCAGRLNGFDNLDDHTIERINYSKPDILFVGMGVPKQELWVLKNYFLINAKIIVTVGAFYSLYSGYATRAPKFFRNLSLEWFIRLIQEPVRLWKRYLIEYPQFVYSVFKEHIAK